MKNIRYFLRLTGAFLSRFKSIIALGVIIGIVIFLFLRFLGPRFIPSDIETIGITGKYKIENLPNEILSLIGNGLTKLNDNGELEPNIASSWETSDSGQTWTFHLKDGLSWQDGKKIDSKSINYVFSDAKIEKPDDKTIIFKLQSPFAPFPVVVSKPVFKKGLLGSGEWKVNKISLVGDYVERLEISNKENSKKIYKFYPTEDRNKLAFKLGQVGILTNIFNVEPFNKWGKVAVKEEISSFRIATLFINTSDSLLSEKSLRQALAYAINKDALPGERAFSPISSTSWAYNPQVKPYNFDIERAKSLIAALPKEVKSNLNINLATPAVLLKEAETIAKNWEAIGVKTNVKVTSGIPSDYQTFLGILDIPRDPDQYSLWHSTQESTNISKYKSPRIDKLLEDGRIQINQEERKKIYLDFQRFLVEDLPAIFLYYPVTYTVIR